MLIEETSSIDFECVYRGQEREAVAETACVDWIPGRYRFEFAMPGGSRPRMRRCKVFGGGAVKLHPE